ncbi:DNA mismatch repair endonuclease MutL [bacterium]|nr:DNA mismatch repair endonuclease MutL [bacterium]
MGRIVQLSKNVINQIAAGEVIERPFSVVKELVENSVDAGATRISIEVFNECRNLRVADNGSGIHPDDILLAFSKHATSKILTGDDLYAVKTMGFRGEALASIISISKLTCITRTKDFDYGTKVECENSEVKKAQTGCAIGTIMDIKDLFYNLPARLKFLKSPKTEFAYINELIQSLALTHPDVAFELKNNGKTTLKTTGQNDLGQTVKEVFSDEVLKNLRPVLKTDRISNLKISGLISTPDYTRASKKDYYMYVNSRIVKCPIFQKSIDMAYKNLIGSRYPFIILNLEIPPEDVDVNVHPTKKEVRYKNPNQIFNFIHSAIDMALSGYVEKEQPQVTEEQVANEVQEEVQQLQVVNHERIPSFQPKSSDDVYISDKQNIGYVFENTQNKNIEDIPQKSVVREFSKSEQANFVASSVPEVEDMIIGQYKKTYILIEKEEGLEIVDQHIAEERYIYEKLKNSKNIDCQLLFISDVLEVSPSDKELLEHNRDKLEKFGYGIEFMSDHEVIFKKVPQLLSRVSPKEILADILENISGDIDNME